MAVTSAVPVPVTDTAYGNIATNETYIAEERLKDAGSTEEVVRTYFSDIPVMIQVARCESHFRHTLEDGTVLKGRVDSADTGVMQINLRYHQAAAKQLDLDLYDLYDNLAYARSLYEKQGTQPWSASAPCWEPTIAMR